MRAKMQALARSSQKLGEARYKSAGAGAGAAEGGPEDGGGAGAGGGAGKGAGEEKVVDAEFEEVDEEEKKRRSN
jgi:molecular chaperone DnaK